MTTFASQIASNYAAVNRRIEAACSRAGRPVSSVTLVAVTKYARIEWMQALVDLGVRDLGESRPQQLVERVRLFPPEVRWHQIGHLQSNKAKLVLPLATLIHSVDSLRLLSRINDLAADASIRPRVLLEVNVSGEASKDGFGVDELRDAWSTVLRHQHVEVRGWMTMAPLTGDLEATRPVFRELRRLRDELAKASPADVALPELSMGMSRDFEIAIEEGATLVRVGSDLFEGLE